MEVQVLVSTMNQQDAKIYKNMNINTNALIINQCGYTDKCKDTISGKTIELYSYDEYGLSKSRNKALENAQAEICIISDDDVIFVEQLEEIVIRAFKDNPEYDILTFQVEGIDEVFKKYINKERKIGYIRSMKISSVEIAFRLDSIRAKGIQFNEVFGSGAQYSMGEENIFLYECLRQGLKIKYIPVKIANLYVGESTWFKGYTDTYFRDKGAAYTAMSKRWGGILIYQFAIRKYTLYKKEKGCIKALTLMLEGRRMYIKELARK